jgi:hypothetical protein
MRSWLWDRRRFELVLRCAALRCWVGVYYRVLSVASTGRCLSVFLHYTFPTLEDFIVHSGVATYSGDEA